MLSEKQAENWRPIFKNTIKKWKWWSKEYVLDKLFILYRSATRVSDYRSCCKSWSPPHLEWYQHITKREWYHQNTNLWVNMDKEVKHHEQGWRRLPTVPCLQLPPTTQATPRGPGHPISDNKWRSFLCCHLQDSYESTSLTEILQTWGISHAKQIITVAKIKASV